MKPARDMMYVPEYELSAMQARAEIAEAKLRECENELRCERIIRQDVERMLEVSDDERDDARRRAALWKRAAKTFWRGRHYSALRKLAALLSEGP